MYDFGGNLLKSYTADTATDPETGETKLKQVVQTFVNEASEFVYLTTSEGTITATPTHPFYVPENIHTNQEPPLNLVGSVPIWVPSRFLIFLLVP